MAVYMIEHGCLHDRTWLSTLFLVLVSYPGCVGGEQHFVPSTQPEYKAIPDVWTSNASIVIWCIMIFDMYINICTWHNSGTINFRPNLPTGIKWGRLQLPYSGKLSREKTFANWWKIRFLRRKLSWIVTFAAPKDATPPNIMEKTFINSHQTVKFAKVFFLESFLLYSISA